MKRFFVGIVLACMLAVSAVPADAAIVHKKAVTNVVNLVGKACDNIAGVIWRNKGAVAVGTAATVAITAPEAVAQGVATVATGTTNAFIKSNVWSSILFYVLLPIILIALTWRFFKSMAFKSRGLLRYWKIIPLVLAMLLMG